MKAAERGQREAVRELVCAGGDVFGRSKASGKTARELANKQGIREDLDAAQARIGVRLLLIYLQHGKTKPFDRIPETAIRQLAAYI